LKGVLDIIFILVGGLPLTFRVWLGRGCGWICRNVLRFRRQLVQKHLDMAFPELDVSARTALSRRVYRHLGLLFVELLALPRLRPRTLARLVSIRGTENVRSALAEGRGVLILAAHVGNWELGLAATQRLGIESRTVVKEIKGQLGQYAAARIRGAHGVQAVIRRGALKAILATLRDRGVVGFVLDQNVTADEGVFVEFFGRPACTLPGLAVIAQRSGAPVVPIVMYRDPDLRHHHVEFLAPVPWASLGGSRDADIRHNTQRYTRIIETMIREHPEQWLWLHRRWRTQPGAAPPADRGGTGPGSASRQAP